MENLVEKLQRIQSDFKSIGNPSQDDVSKFKQQEFDLFGEITTIAELCQYYQTDMAIDGMSQAFISGMCSGTVNGAMFVINEIRKALSNCKDKENLSEAIETTIKHMQGID